MDAAADEALTWFSHPVLHSHWKTCLLLVVMLLSGIGTYLFSGDLGWGICAISFILLGVYDYLMPTRFSVTEEGIASKVFLIRRFKSWEEIRSYYINPSGIFVSPFAGRSRLEGHRGIFLRFDPQQEAIREAVLARIRGNLVVQKDKPAETG